MLLLSIEHAQTIRTSKAQKTLGLKVEYPLSVLIVTDEREKVELRGSRLSFKEGDCCPESSVSRSAWASLSRNVAQSLRCSNSRHANAAAAGEVNPPPVACRLCALVLPVASAAIHALSRSCMVLPLLLLPRLSLTPMPPLFFRNDS